MIWQRSKNRHGLWDDLERVAYIGVEKGKSNSGRYHWHVDVHPQVSGTTHTLKEAKEYVADALRSRGIDSND